jgi:hypothetical protein
MHLYEIDFSVSSGYMSLIPAIDSSEVQEDSDSLPPVVIINNTILIYPGKEMSPDCNGNCNRNFVVRNFKGEPSMIQRRQSEKIRRQTEDDIRKELTEISGFIPLGGDYHMRTPTEKKAFALHALAVDPDLKVIPYTYADNTFIQMPFKEQTITLKDYLLNGNTELTGKILDHLITAHSKNIIFGDRWTANTLITKNNEFHEIDYDIELFGNWAKEYELAQCLYHMIHFAADRPSIIQVLNDYIDSHSIETSHNIETLLTFLQNYTSYYASQESYEDTPTIQFDEISPFLQRLAEKLVYQNLQQQTQ